MTTTDKPQRFDPVAAVRRDLLAARRELGRTEAIAALLRERVQALETWIEAADELGLTGERPEIPRAPLLMVRDGSAPPSAATQWDWVRFALLQSSDPAPLREIQGRIEYEGGPAISRTSLASLLGKRERSGDVEHVGRAWRLTTGTHTV